jgi:uncharacterized protein with von Willebrand factor type A (vWA) domain
MKALFCARQSDWAKFDDIFDAFWLGRGMRRVILLNAHADTARSAELRQMPHSRSASDGDAGLADQLRPTGGDHDQRHAGSLARMEGASRVERLAETDFRKIADPAAMDDAHALAERLARRMRTRFSRRERARRKGRRIDLRRTIRRNISHGGIPIDLLRRNRKRKPLRLVVLLDASGSMSLYTAVFVRFIHGVLDNFREAEAFLFHTRLVHVSAVMRDKDVGRAFERLSLLAQGVGGGTRIGECLATFNRWHARNVIHSRTCVMIISDGYDTGPPEALDGEMCQLARRCKRIVWLNPMIGWEGYAPEARGMRAALPYVNLFAPAHNIKSLAALEPYLARL